jgi:hypothetical protein
MKHMTLAELEERLDHITQSPLDEGIVRLIVRRPGTGSREVVDEAQLDCTGGLIGDNWHARRSAHADMQLTIMNSRAAQLLAGDADRWPLAGDQLYVDFNLSESNLPPGTRLARDTRIPDMARLKAWYDSPEYRPLRALRHRAARSRLVAIEGTS